MGAQSIHGGMGISSLQSQILLQPAHGSRRAASWRKQNFLGVATQNFESQSKGECGSNKLFTLARFPGFVRSVGSWTEQQGPPPLVLLAVSSQKRQWKQKKKLKKRAPTAFFSVFADDDCFNFQDLQCSTVATEWPTHKWCNF